MVFTFELGKDNSTYFSDVWTYIDSVTAPDPRSVQFKLKTKPLNPGLVRNYIANTLIMPKAVWSKIDGSKLASEPNLKPVGSGPFTLDKADQTQVNLKRHDDYWGKAVYGTPAMTTINHPIFKTNNDANLKLESGELDASQTFFPQIWKLWEDKNKPVGTWLKEKPYYLPGSQPQSHLNLTGQGPGQRQGPAGHRLRHRLPQHRRHSHVGLLRAGQRQPDPAQRVRVEVLRRSGRGRRGLEVRQGQGDQHPGG